MLHHIYSAYVFWRNCFFDIGLLKRRKAHLPVISVGNIVAGGTGKTSLVYRIASDLKVPVGILSRGYGAKVKVQSQQVRMPEEGDEAYLLSKKLPTAQVIVGKDRIKSAKTLQDVRCILLDDGMQHRYIQRDIEIVILHAHDPFGGGAYLPKGRLRDSPKRLKSADWIFVNGGVCDHIKKYSDAPVIGIQYKIENQSEIEGRRIAAFCGIGTPSTFYQMLEEIGCRILLKRTLPDHSPFHDISPFLTQAKKLGVDLVVTTEKDYVKLKDTTNIRPLIVTLDIVYGEEHYKRLLEEILKLSS